VQSPQKPRRQQHQQQEQPQCAPGDGAAMVPPLSPVKPAAPAGFAAVSPDNAGAHDRRARSEDGTAQQTAHHALEPGQQLRSNSLGGGDTAGASPPAADRKGPR